MSSDADDPSSIPYSINKSIPDGFQKIFPPHLIDSLTNDVVEKFLAAIGDGSEQGVAISTAEAEQFEGSNAALVGVAVPRTSHSF